MNPMTFTIVPCLCFILFVVGTATKAKNDSVKKKRIFPGLKIVVALVVVHSCLMMKLNRHYDHSLKNMPHHGQFPGRSLEQHRQNQNRTDQNQREVKKDVVISANFSAVFSTDKAVPSRGQVPKESEWLLSSTDHPSPISYKQIPRIINKVYLQRDGEFQRFKEGYPKNLMVAHKSWQDKNPGYKLQYYNMRLARTYLKKYFHSVFLRAFDCIVPFAGRADFFRMVIVYREGGWYSDWKQVCLKHGVLDMISNATDFWAARNKPNNPCINFANALFGAIPRHRIIAQTLEKLLTGVQSMHYGKKPWAATGPCVFGEAITEIGYNETLMGAFRGNSRYKLTPTSEETIVLHKCNDCGGGQDWANGNNYWELWNQRRFYCEDAAMIFD